MSLDSGSFDIHVVKMQDSAPLKKSCSELYQDEPCNIAQLSLLSIVSLKSSPYPAECRSKMAGIGLYRYNQPRIPLILNAVMTSRVVDITDKLSISYKLARPHAVLCVRVNHLHKALPPFQSVQ